MILELLVIFIIGTTMIGSVIYYTLKEIINFFSKK